ncbi:MAG: putative Ig domain-containing protein [Spirochaetaceae bacterium]|nr:putative Ig domain-containing protein [Spirochaetaceae bacterium]
MQQKPDTAPGAHRRRRWRPLAAALPAALTTLALIGCPTAAPVRVPEFAAPAGDLTYQVDVEIVPVVLPFAAGGSGALTYSLGPEIPPGLAFDADRRTLSGTPTARGDYPLTYRVRDVNGRSDTLSFTITVEPRNLTRSIVSAVTVGDDTGVAKFADLPEPSGGPAVTVSGSRVFMAGGPVFVDVAPEPGASVDKLLVSVGGERFGYYEVDLSDAAASYQVRGQVRFDVDPEIESGCVNVAAVDAGGAVGPVTCHEMLHAAVDFADVMVTVSWDSDADLDLTVVDGTGEAVYYGNTESSTGGAFRIRSSCGTRSWIRNEHIGWSRGTPPEGHYEVRLNHWWNCGTVEQTNYVVSVYNHGQVSTFSGTFTGPGARVGPSDEREITRFEVGDGPPPRTRRLGSTYRGHGDQVFVLNADGETLDKTVYTLDLGDATAEVYLIATNTAYYDVQPEVRRLDRIEAVAKGLLDELPPEYQPAPRPATIPSLGEREWIAEFNNNPPLPAPSARASRRAHAQAGPDPVAEGDRFTYYDQDDDRNLVPIPATARRVVTDGSRTAAFWVADDDWGAGCRGAGPCVTAEMVDAMADRFLRPGAGNDIHDWVTATFGEPWGPHDIPILIPPAAAREIHVLLYDIGRDGEPGPGECRAVGYFWARHNFLRDPDEPGPQLTAERLAFFMDAPWFAIADGPTWEVTDRRPSGAIGTLAHEFQHMIHFYQKPVLRDTGSETWLNEMASEVAEDLISDRMMVRGPRGVAYDDPTAGEPGNRRGRLPYYNLFNDQPVTVWNSKIADYAGKYAFGAYLARTYGGAALFSAIVQSDKAGFRAVEAALQALGHDVPFGQLVADWAVATLLSDDTAAAAPYRYNAGAWTTSHTGGVDYRLGSINLYNYRFDPPEVISDCIGPDLASRSSQEGPYLHSLSSLSDRTQPPHSNAIATLGRNTGTVRMLVTAEAENRITVVVKE